MKGVRSTRRTGDGEKGSYWRQPDKRTIRQGENNGIWDWSWNEGGRHYLKVKFTPFTPLTPFLAVKWLHLPHNPAKLIAIFERTQTWFVRTDRKPWKENIYLFQQSYLSSRQPILVWLNWLRNIRIITLTIVIQRFASKDSSKLLQIGSPISKLGIPPWQRCRKW